MLFDGIICLILHIGLLSPVRRCKNTRVMGAIKNNLNSCEESLVNGTNDREAHPKRWVAALVQMNCEKKVASKLDKLGITNYVPTQKEEHQWSDRKKIIDRIVIPMVVFVHLTQNEEDEFRKLPFILKFITYPGSSELATPIPDEQIVNLRTLLEKATNKVCFESITIRNGDKVKIVSGPLEGMHGLVINDNTGATYLVLQIDILGCAKLQIETDKLLKID